MAKHRDMNNIDRTAADWAARRDRGPLSVREQAELDTWLARDPRHLGAYARAQAVLAYFERAGALGAQYDPRHFPSAQGENPDNPGRRKFLWLAGAGMAAGCAGVFLTHTAAHHVSTRLGEILRVPLHDGSAMTLNSATEAVVRFDQSRRLVHLLKGEALFDVAKDALRPFVVKAAQASVVAVGTSFTVENTVGDPVKVMVREGKVDFRIPEIEPQRLSADMLAKVGPSERIEVQALRPLEVKRRLAWRDGMLSFDGDTLAQAAAQFSRYSSTKIVIDDPAVAARRVVGLYSSTDPVGFARAVALSMDLQVERKGDVVQLAAASVR